ncbi:transcriptional regulator, RpiR family [Anaerovirgula multivorans]|uniref:Transcriptional regulator, RpiR family n=1 Tax=Anaerovirgula multivorans TaxID=312168 RepID=A0A239DGH4_9FIRM|nr:MurR/RpiR family transcriptional regulator [Anaerovirgula multivorans]SNS31616.1 transcriptional regulator, RpiR family [Anaerovirgula multivorans]
MTLDNLIRYNENLTPIENQLAQYILTHKDVVEKLSITDLSEITFVSKSAIHRFCKKIGFNGYNELKVKIAQDIANQNTSVQQIDVNYPFDAEDSPRMIAQKLLRLYESTITDTHNFIDMIELNKVSQLLNSAQIIDIYTHAHNISIAENFQDKMRSIGRMVNCADAFYTQRCMATASRLSHVAIILSYSGRAYFIPSITKTLYKKKIPIVLIGKAGNNQFSHLFQHRLYISDQENLRNRISQFSSHIAMQYLLDVLYGCIFNLSYHENIKYIQETISIIDDRNLNE